MSSTTGAWGIKNKILSLHPFCGLRYGTSFKEPSHCWRLQTRAVVRKHRIVIQQPSRQPPIESLQIRKSLNCLWRPVKSLVCAFILGNFGYVLTLALEQLINLGFGVSVWETGFEALRTVGSPLAARSLACQR